jgi:hypothetical protein
MITTNTMVIYIQLLDEGTIVYRPTLGEMLKENIFKVLPTEHYDPSDEVWEFPPGTLVRCEYKNLSHGKVLVAKEAVS